MVFLWNLFHQIYDVETLVRVGGLAAIAATVFTETGLFVGFFLPGDSLLVTAGIFAASGALNIWTLNIVLASPPSLLVECAKSRKPREVRVQDKIPITDS